jgi:NTP pyrophosphatase (non-canonical NTP hydrolase)
MVNLSAIFRALAEESHEASKQWFPDTAEDLGHHALAMCGEVGEVANIVKKLQRGSLERDEAEKLLQGELADVFIYLLNICAIAKIDLAAAYYVKQKINQERF